MHQHGKRKIHCKKQSSRYFKDKITVETKNRKMRYILKRSMLRKERKYREIRNKKKSMGIKNRQRSAKIQII